VACPRRRPAALPGPEARGAQANRPLTGVGQTGKGGHRSIGRKHGGLPLLRSVSFGVCGSDAARVYLDCGKALQSRRAAGVGDVPGDCGAVPPKQIVPAPRLEGPDPGHQFLDRLLSVSCGSFRRLHVACSGPAYLDRSQSSWPRCHGSPGAMSSPQRAQDTRPVATGRASWALRRLWWAR
jgi:hypothetical protein